MSPVGSSSFYNVAKDLDNPLWTHTSQDTDFIQSLCDLQRTVRVAECRSLKHQKLAADIRPKNENNN